MKKEKKPIKKIKENLRFKGIKRAFIVDVLEGEGTFEDVMRVVSYVYTEEGQYVGKIDFSRCGEEPTLK